MADTMQAHALALAERGLYVFPLRPSSKQPATPHWNTDASCRAENVRAMFAPRWDGLEKGIGIACGPSGLLVVDLDGDAGMSHRGKFPATLTALTGRGAHLYYRGEGRSTAGHLAPGIDTRGAGGYVVAPPSLHPNGHRYRWERVDIGPAPLPDSIREKLKPRAKAPRPRRLADPCMATLSLHLAVERFRQAVPGSRNNALNREVWYSSNLERPELLAVLWYAEADAAGLGAEESVRTIASALGRSAAEVSSWL